MTIPVNSLTLLSIQSWVCYGHVGNAAALFPLQRLGAEVISVNTVQFSNHTGYKSWTGAMLDSAGVDALIKGIEARGVFSTLDGVLSGYLGGADIGQSVLNAVQIARKMNPSVLYCCDPVMGDEGRGIYVKEGVAEFFKNMALSYADILTPNLFELQILSDMHHLTSLDGLKDAVKILQQKMRPEGPAIVLVTSAVLQDTPKNMLDVIVADRSRMIRVRTPLLDITPTGTGDITAALFFFHYLKEKDIDQALARAISSVWGILSYTASHHAPELQIISAQKEIIDPTHMYEGEEIQFG